MVSPPLDSRDLRAFAEPSAVAILAELTEALAPSIQILRPLGAGAMGLVVLGRDPLLKRYVAIKVLSPALADDVIARARFIREAEASAAVSHPNIVNVYLVGELPHTKTPYFIMQFVEGHTLGEELGSGSAISEQRARRLVGEIASALAAAHARGLVHRDVKPANIILENETDRPIVLDFGISAILQPAALGESKLTNVGMYLGTPTYMSPEQASGEPVTGKSDVYSLGAMAYEIETGRPPFDGPPVVVMAAHVQQPAPSVASTRSGADPALAALIERCLRKNPAERPSASDIAHSLLPSRRELIEWPPPGLEPLRGAGEKLSSRWAVASVLLLAFFALLYLRPTSASPLWSQEEGSMLWRGIVRSSQAVTIDPLGETDVPQRAQGIIESTPIWVFLLGITVVGLLAAAMTALVHTVRVGRELVRAQRAGYPRRVAFDVAWDASDDTGALLNGTGRYGLLSSDERDHVVRLRRWRAVAMLAAILAMMAMPLLWLMLGGWSNGSANLVTDGELGLLALPLLSGAIAIATIEQRIRRVSGVPTVSARRTRIRRESVQAWLSSAGSDAPAKTRRALSTQLLTVISVAGLGVVAYAALVVFIVIALATSLLMKGQSAAAEWRRSIGTNAQPVKYGELIAAARRSAVATTGSVPDTEALRLLVARRYVASGGTPPVALNVDLEGARRVQASGPEPIHSVPVEFYAIGDTVLPSRDRVQRVAAYAESPWLEVWRRFARSPAFAVLPTLKSGAPGLRYPVDIPLPPFTLKDLAYRNFTAGYVAFMQGDVAQAEIRARENIAVGGHFLASETTAGELVGIVILSLGRQQLKVIGNATHRQDLVDEAERLRALGIRRRASMIRPYSTFAMLADPSSSEALQDAQILGFPSEYGDVMFHASYAYCQSPREILFGIDTTRLAQIHRVVTAGANPIYRDLEQLSRNWIVDANAGRAALPRDANRVPPLAPPAWLAPGLHQRLATCLFVSRM